MPHTKRKYICYGGDVASTNDGQRHHIPAQHLPELYGVPLDECLIINPARPIAMHGVDTAGLIPLRPDPTGEYKLPSG